MDFRIAIPSYSRVKELGEKTLEMLNKYKCPKNKIDIFVTPEQYDEYKTAYPDYNFVKAKGDGILETRNFITLYYKDGEKLLNIDDDVVGIFRRIGQTKRLEEINPLIFAKCAFLEAAKLGIEVWGVNPVYNPYTGKDKTSTDLRYIVAAFRGVINRHKLLLEGFDQKEDVEYTILAYKNKGGVLRFNNIRVKTIWYAPGGLAAYTGSKEKRIIKSKEAVDWLEKKYPEFGSTIRRVNGIYEFKLKRKPKLEGGAQSMVKIPEDKDAPVLIKLKTRPPFDTAKAKFIEEIEKVTIPKIKHSSFYPKGHPKEGQVKVSQRDLIIGRIGRTENFGFGKTRSGYKPFVANKRYPELFKALVELGNTVVPKNWHYSAITLNVGVKAKKHIDNQNVGMSVIIAVGDFTDGGLYVFNPDGSKKTLIDIHDKPAMFNGAILPHQTQPFKGDRYSIIYYNQKEGARIPGVRAVGKGDDIEELIGEGDCPCSGGVFA